jgi:integral membrane sensor domain MASE1
VCNRPLFFAGAAFLIYKAAASFRNGSAIVGGLNLFVSGIGLAIGVFALINMVTLLLLRSGRGGRFSKRWIKKSLQDAARDPEE